MTFAPTDLSGCTVWLDAGQLGLDDGDPLGSAWPNLGSGGDGNVVGSSPPVVRNNSPFGLPVVRFTANEGQLRGTGMCVDGSIDLTVIYVARTWGYNKGRIFSNFYEMYNFLVGAHVAFEPWCYDGGFIGPAGTWGAIPTPWRLYGYTSLDVPRLGTFYLDGVSQGTGATSYGHDTRWCISGHTATAGEESADCEVAELICYDRALSTTEREQVEDYLRTKWFEPPSVPVAAALSGGGTLSATVVPVGPEIKATASAPVNASRTVTLDFPGYVAQENDLVALWPAAKASSAPITVPGGWTNPRGANAVGQNTGVTSACLYHTVTAAEELAGTTTFTATNLWNTAQTGDVIGLVARGVSAQIPVDFISTAGTNTANATQVVNSFTGANAPRFDNSLMVGAIARANSGTYTAVAAGCTILAQSNNNHGRVLIRRNALTTASVGFTSSAVTASSADTYNSVGLLLVEDFPGTYRATPFSGGGTLSATVARRVEAAAALSADGTLTATVAHLAALHSTGQLQVTVTVYTPPPPDDGGWSVSPGPTVRKHGPSWTETGGGVATMTRPGGWHALVEKVAPLTSVGTLNAVLAPIRGHDTDLTGVGTLSTVLLLRNWRDAALGGSGMFDSSPDPFETRPRTAVFGSTGLLTAVPDDGLSAIISGQHRAYFSGGGGLGVDVGGGIAYGDGLSATVIGRYLYPAYFTGAGELTATLDKLQAGVASYTGTGSLSANVSPVIAVLAQLTASGALSATAAGGVVAIANLLGTGTISATMFAKYLQSVGFSGAGAMTALLLESYQGSASGGGIGTIAALISPRYNVAPAPNGIGTIGATISPVYTPTTATSGGGTMTAATSQIYVCSAGNSGGGVLSATVTKPFTPITETNDPKTANVPINTDGCWVTLVGGGNSGGSGKGQAFANCGGGGGGGGGGVVARSFIPASALGSTYTVVKGGAGAASSFSSGSNSVTANAGGVGTAGTNSGAAAGGTGGTVSVTGFTGLTTYTGGAGGNGGTAGANAGTAGANQTTTSPGGGGGGGRSSGGGTAAGGKGGNSATAAGGTASGGNGGTATAPNPGGGGAGGVSTNGTGGGGGDAGVYGAGGGGGGGGNSTGSGGPGSAGTTKVEWI